MKRCILVALLTCLSAAHADPQLTSWFTANSGKYARIFQSTANETAGTTSTTWSRGTGTQTNPTYADVNEINHSASWVYIRTTGLASHIMGPWYLDAAKTTNFPNFPSNTAVVYRLPRVPVIPGTKTLTGLGATGRMVNGVSMFDSRDAFSYVNASAQDATPVNGLTGDGIWNRDGYHNEGVTFDPGLAHQAGNNYHYHAHPIGLRYQLGDHVDYNATTNRYTESAAAPTAHSPIVAWAADGLPVYGPYGYSDPTNASSGVRRMISGFTLRDGTNGTTAITVRQILPLWAQRVQSRTTLAANQYGPAVTTAVGSAYLLGHYIEDFDYRGDLGQTQTTGATVQSFDLNEQNVRFCLTPEFPSGTWAYFTPINADGTPQYPYTTGRAFYGTPSGGASSAAVMNADTPLTQHFIGGPSKPITISTPVVAAPNVTLTWSAVEGGTYSVDASANAGFSPFTSKATGLVATGISTASTYATLAASGTEYGRVNRTALATYDVNGMTAATVAQTTSTSYNAAGIPNTAPTLTSISAQSTAMNTASSAIAFTIGDAETTAASLTLSASSANTTLVPNASIIFGGSAESRTVTITPAQSQTGSVVITINVSDGIVTTSTTFTLSVTGTNTAPTIGSISAQSTNQNTATSAIAFTVGDVDTGAASLTLSGTSANTTLVPNANIVFGGSGASRTVTLTPATGQTGSAVITLTVSDGAATAISVFTLTVVPTAPTISGIAITPSTPTSVDVVTVSATLTPSAGRTISSAVLTYDNGSTSPTVIFNETMGTAAVTQWVGAGVVYPWTITFAGPPSSPFRQTAAGNHTAVGDGNQFGMEVFGNSPNIAQNTMTTTNNINATGSSGTVEFWVSTTGITGAQGWDFQTATDGATWTTRINEATATNYGFTQKSYTLSAAERVSTLKLRFRFAGGGMNAAPTVRVDDIKVTVGATSTPVNVAMTNTSGNVWSANVPAQPTSTVVTYTLAATDSAAVTTTSASNTYTVTAGAPVLAVTPAGNLSSSGSFGGPFSPASATYTLNNTGNASMNWTAAKTAAWLTLDAASGTLAAGASTTVTASINATANSLASGSYSDTITFTNTTNGTGNTTRGASLTINFTTAPAAPVLAALSAYSQGTAKTITWPAAAGATSYTAQIASAAEFGTVLASQTITGTSATFSNLASGTTYYYRVLATNNIGSSAYSNVVSSTQDNIAPTVAITSPASGTSTATNSITVTGTSSDALSGISRVTVNGVTATTADAFATWSVSAPLGFGSNGLTAVAYDAAGNATTTAPVNVTLTTAQTNNPLIIPEVMTGTTFNLNLHTTTKQFYTGTATNTYAYNNMLFWGPTLIMNKGDWVQINLTNNLGETTTTHWHGFHIPAIMDGGPHQTIPTGTTWKPSFKVDNNAGTYWYHPHLHEFTQKHLSLGGGGMIIIRDPIESALNLPRTYGVDDIPLALTSRRFTANQIVTTASAYGDVMLTNGVLAAQTTLPKQYVRLRILNAEIERSYNLGFSDNRTFYQIATDGGLVNTPVALTRLVLAVGERAEILVDLSADTIGSTFNLQAFNTGQANDFPGGEPGTTGQFGSLLNNTTFTVLKINVGAATANPVTTLPATLTTNTFYGLGDVTNTRTVTFTNGFPGSGIPFGFDNVVYSPTVINQTLNLNAVERWNISNTSAFSHSFHIHDVQFHLISRTGGNNVGVKNFEEGWKDTLFVGQNQTVSFIAKFDGFASNTNPFMYHCHFSNHEDEGAMGQFVVQNNAVEDLAVASFTRYGNDSLIQLDFNATPGTTYTLEWSPDLATWSDVGSVTSDGNSASFTETDTTRLQGVRGFYRVKVPTITAP
ncbi:MAG: multicopper oxidase domain-containing protein [Prosthecobacter sp.]|uniref:multicopper oxidase domain-containing protein n=1 Tax=Prosthecobacter sp. TaxID=1965333 RepID=UPI0038FDCE39